jgi:hypothetical protein
MYHATRQNKLVVPAACSESPIAVDFRVPARPSLLDIWRAAREERSGTFTVLLILSTQSHTVLACMHGSTLQSSHCVR